MKSRMNWLGKVLREMQLDILVFDFVEQMGITSMKNAETIMDGIIDLLRDVSIKHLYLSLRWDRYSELIYSYSDHSSDSSDLEEEEELDEDGIPLPKPPRLREIFPEPEDPTDIPQVYFANHQEDIMERLLKVSPSLEYLSTYFQNTDRPGWKTGKYWRVFTHKNEDGVDERVHEEMTEAQGHERFKTGPDNGTDYEEYLSLRI
ncbi:hypothetical protein ABKN59_003726 [Abortiporus biennis]